MRAKGLDAHHLTPISSLVYVSEASAFYKLTMRFHLRESIAPWKDLGGLGKLTKEG